MEYVDSLIFMIISEILLLGIALFLKKEKKSQLRTAFYCFIMCLSIWTLCSILQILFQNTKINPFFWEQLAGFGVCLSPVAFFLLSKVFAKTKMNFKMYHLLLFIIPIISIIMGFTNDYHHLYFKQYSINMNETVWGEYFIVHSIYSYLLYGIGIFYYLKYSIRNSGFFSKQSLLIILGSAIPLILNVLGGLNIIKMTMYITPISFSFAAICYAIAIFKFKFLKIAPIALQRIVDRISDSYIVINEKNIIIDFNKTLLDTLKIKDENIRDKDVFQFMKKQKMDTEKIEQAVERVSNSDITERFEMKIEKIGKYFTVEINAIRQKGQFLGTLILFKDITQHMQDMQTIKNNQDMLMERERLASLGQLIGGIAHNLKTPIMSIAGASEGLIDLTKEYEVSIGDPEVTIEDHHEIAQDMYKWINKIKEYTEYMSDVITAVKGQAVTLSAEQAISFNLDELVKRVDILMKHELKNALINLNIKMDVDSEIILKGNINSLVQVINNMISNAIQAYNGKTNQEIDLILSKNNNNIIISVRDYAGGLPKNVQDKLFKEMITTKGKNGTGLGLFMSYSNIRAHFNGNITYETEKDKCTTFNIILPI